MKHPRDFRALRKGFVAAAIAGLMALPASAETLKVMQSEAPRSMDPADQTATFTQVVLSPIYEGLVDRDAENKLVPKLATSWSSNDDGTEWTFKLRDGVTFQDGTAMDASAVVASFKRLLDPARGLAAAGKVKGIIASVVAVDDSTVKFTLAKPYAGFVDLLATSVGWIVSPKADAAGTLDTAAVGTGPFMLKDYDANDHVDLVDYDGYWGDKPKLDGIDFTWTSEPSVLAMAVQSGDADVVNPLPPVFAGAVKANPQMQLIDQPGSAVFWVSLNVKMAPLDKVKVRQALNFATDKPALVKALLRGYGIPANSPIAPTNPAWDKDLNPYPYDIDKAKALLADAGVPDGFKMSVAVQESEAPIAEALQGMWAKIGVDLEVRRLESGVWSKAAFNGPDAKAEDGLGAVIASWSSGSFNSDLQFRPLYSTSAWAPAGANLGFFSSEKLDKLIDTAAATTDTGKRDAMYVEAQKLVNDEAPHVLLYYSRDLAGAAAKVKGLSMQPGGMLVVKNASISE